MDLSPTHDFVLSCIGYLKILFTQSSDLLNVDTIHYTISNTHHQSHQKNLQVLGNRQAHSYSGEYKFSKILTFPWSLELKINTVFLEAIGSFSFFFHSFIFDKTSPYIQVWVTTVFLSVILLSKKCAPWKKTATQPTNQTTAHVLFFETATVLWLVCSRVDLKIPPIWSHRILKRHVLKGWDSIKLMFFIASLRLFLSETGFFSF